MHSVECSLSCAFVLGNHPNLSLAFAWTPNRGLKVNAKDECQGRMQIVECKGRMRRPNAKEIEVKATTGGLLPVLDGAADEPCGPPIVALR